jgi:hypothetical protein
LKERKETKMTDKEFLAGFKSECLHNVPEIRARDARLDEIAGKLKLLEKMVAFLESAQTDFALGPDAVSVHWGEAAKDLLEEYEQTKGDQK